LDEDLAHRWKHDGNVEPLTDLNPQPVERWHKEVQHDECQA
jgi:hypothetical protein